MEIEYDPLENVVLRSSRRGRQRSMPLSTYPLNPPLLHHTPNHARANQVVRGQWSLRSQGLLLAWQNVQKSVFYQLRRSIGVHRTARKTISSYWRPFSTRLRWVLQGSVIWTDVVERVEEDGEPMVFDEIETPMEVDEPSTVQDEVTSDNELHIPNEIVHEILNHYLHSLPIREDNLDAILLPASVCRGWQIYICERTSHWPILDVSFQRESSVIRNTTLTNFLHSPAGAAAPVPSPLTIDMSKFDHLHPEHVGLLESALELLPRANDALKLRSPGPPEMAWSRLKWTAIQNAIFEGRKLRALILEGDLPMDFCHKALSICGTGLEKLSLKGVSQASKRLPWPLPRVPLPALEDLEMEFVTDIRQLVTSLDCPKITNLALSTDSEWLMEDVAGYDFHYANLTKLVCRAPEYTRLAAAEKILQRTPNLEALEWIGDCITHGQQQLVSLQLPFLRSLKVSHLGRQDSVFETLLNKSQVYDEVCLPNLLLPVHTKTLRINTPMSTLACLSLLADSQHLEEGFFELNDSIEDVDEFTISMYLSPQTPSLNVPNLRKVTFLVHGPNRGFYQRLPIPRGVEVVIRNCLKCEMLGGGSFCDSL